MSNPRILIVDDEEIIRNLVLEVIEDLGYRGSAVSDGYKAIESLKKERYDLMITDIKMPGIDGLELINKAKEVSPELITIIITGYASIETARKAIREGAYDYILKPFDLGELKTAISNAIEKRRLERENARLRELAELFHVSQAIRSHIAGEEVFNVLLGTAVAQSDSDRGLILALDDEGRYLLSISFTRFTEAEKECYPVDEKVKLWINGEDKPFIIGSDPYLQKHSVQNGIHYFKANEISLGSMLDKDEQLIAFPLRVMDKFYGVMCVVKKGEGVLFTKGDIILLGIIVNQAATSIENMTLLRNIQHTYYDTVKSLALLLEARDPYTHGHSERVGDICVFLGLKIGLSSKDLELLKIASNLHDIGKIAINESLLNKPRKLTEEEFLMVRKHPVIGDEILKPIRFLEKARPLIRGHHERYDGKGYPDGLDKHTLTPLLNIIIIADAFDAMNSSRPYRNPLTIEEIKSELRENSGTQFDPQLSMLLLNNLENGDLVKFIGKSNPAGNQ